MALSYPRLENGRVIYEPPKEPAPAALDINQATEAELTEAGFTPTQAARVVARREEFGAFSSVDELLELPRFGVKALDAIRDRIRV